MHLMVRLWKMSTWRVCYRQLSTRSDGMLRWDRDGAADLQALELGHDLVRVVVVANELIVEGHVRRMRRLPRLLPARLGGWLAVTGWIPAFAGMTDERRFRHALPALQW